jgi:nitrogen fixation/metabolism regulation signal transduction histidine kinase
MQDISRLHQLDEALQRLQTIRSGQSGAHSDPILKQTLRQLDRAIEELQVMVEELSERDEELGRVADAVAQERTRRTELMETLAVPCLLTDRVGTIHEANTSALLLLGESLQRLGQNSLRDRVEDAAEFDALISRTATEPSATGTIVFTRPGPDRLTVRASTARIRNVNPPLWRWFLLREDRPRP